MTLEELKTEAKRQGYRLTKIPNYTCMCVCEYPRLPKCAERYEPVPSKGKMTHCRRKEEKE